MHTMRTVAILSFVFIITVAFAYSCAGSSSGDTGAANDGGAGADTGGQDAGALDAGGETYPKQAKLTRGPWLGNVTTDAVTLRWETDRAAIPAVNLSGAAAGTQKGASTQHTYKVGIDNKEVVRFQHSVRLIGLPSDASVTYDIPDLSTPTTASFVTAPTTAKPFRFTVYGDTRPAGPYFEDNPEHMAITTAMAAEKPDFYIHTGDMGFSGGMESEWYLFFATSTPLMPCAPIYPVFGNHDVGGEARWADLFDLPGDGGAKMYYSWDYSNTHFTVLCVECGLDASGAQVTWLAADLAAAHQNSAIGHIFVSFHEPAYTYSTHAPDSAAQQNVVPLLKQYQARAVFAGHNHLYERIIMDGITYLTIGGGGAPLYDEQSGDHQGLVKFAKEYHYTVIDVDAAQVKFSVKNDTSTEIDAFTLP